MSKLVLTNAKIWVAQYDISGDSNKVALEFGADVKDRTPFGQTFRQRISGRKSCGFAAEGFYEAGTDLVDPALFGRIGLNDVPITLAAEGGDDGERAWSFLSVFGEYNALGEGGEVAPFTASAQGSSALAAGTILHNATRVASGNGTARELGAVSATQKLYAALHVITVSGAAPTLDVIVQSDADSGFASPISRITFGQKTAKSSEWATPVAGAITDTWWRVNYTIGGGSPSFLFVVNVGIL